MTKNSSQTTNEAPLLSCDICYKTEAELIDNQLRVVEWVEKDFCHICEECEEQQ